MPGKPDTSPLNMPAIGSPNLAESANTVTATDRSNRVPGEILKFRKNLHSICSEAASLFPSTRNSVTGTRNSAFPQFKQRNSSGNTHTMGMLRPSSPGEWMATSAVNLRCLCDPHHGHVIGPSPLTRIDCVATTRVSLVKIA